MCLIVTKATNATVTVSRWDANATINSNWEASFHNLQQNRSCPLPTLWKFARFMSSAGCLLQVFTSRTGEWVKIPGGKRSTRAEHALDLYTWEDVSPPNHDTLTFQWNLRQEGKMKVTTRRGELPQRPAATIPANKRLEQNLITALSQWPCLLQCLLHWLRYY